MIGAFDNGDLVIDDANTLWAFGGGDCSTNTTYILCEQHEQHPTPRELYLNLLFCCSVCLRRLPDNCFIGFQYDPRLAQARLVKLVARNAPGIYGQPFVEVSARFIKILLRSNWSTTWKR